MEKEAWKTDEAMEMALLKSCLLFSEKNLRESNGTILEKKILSLIFQGTIKNVKDIEAYCHGDEEDGFDAKAKGNLCDSIISGLKKKKFITVNPDGEIKIVEKIQVEANEIGKVYNNGKSDIVNAVLDDVKKEYRKTLYEEAQIKTNIKNCIEYYLYVSSFTLLGYDEKDKISDSKLKEIAGAKLRKGGEELTDHICYSIGRLIENPTDEQRETLTVYAKVIMLYRIIGRDPLLRDFKRTKISQKNFVIDTDVMLYCLTKHTKRGRDYLEMINCLTNSGCKLYIQDEIIKEVYDHAEAATKRYSFQSEIIEKGDIALVKCNGHNVFIEDYMYGEEKGSSAKWEQYIQNFYDPEYGTLLIQGNVRHVFGERVHYGTFPEINSPIPPDDDDYKELYKEVLDATQKSPNAKYRDEEKNKRIASVDTLLYLSIKKANLKQMDREGQKQSGGVLCHDYYILTNTIRTHKCAKEKGMEYDVLCSPQAMILYLTESGLLNNCALDVSDLFENPFFAYISGKYWNDMDNFIKAGIDIRGKSIVRLRLDLERNLNALLTTDVSTNEYMQAYKDTTKKGYIFNENIRRVAEEAIKKEEENRSLKDQIAKLTRVNELLAKGLKKAKYEKRIRLDKGSKGPTRGKGI